MQDARRITRVCPTPLLVDIDTGFGATSLNIARTVQDMEAAGVAGVSARRVVVVVVVVMG